MELINHGIYRLPDGREFLVRAGQLRTYALHDLRLGVASAPVYLVDGSGQLLSWGRPTRWRVSDLSDTGSRAVPELQRITLL